MPDGTALSTPQHTFLLQSQGNVRAVQPIQSLPRWGTWGSETSPQVSPSASPLDISFPSPHSPRLPSFPSLTGTVPNQPTEWEKLFLKHISDKRLASRIYEGFLQLNNKKDKQSAMKYKKNLNRNFSREDIQMANKHLKTCSISLVIGEMQVRIIMRYHFTPTRMAIIKDTQWRVQMRMWANWNSHTLKRMQNAAATLKTVWQSLKGETQSNHVSQQLDSSVYT